MKMGYTMLFIIPCIICSCAGKRPMTGYYENHPEMRQRLLKAHRLYLSPVRGAADKDEAEDLRASILEELKRKGRGRFIVVNKSSRADAVLEADMKEEFKDQNTGGDIPFTIGEDRIERPGVYLRMTILDEESGRIIYQTNSHEFEEIDSTTIEKAAHTVVRNLMQEIEFASNPIP